MYNVDIHKLREKMEVYLHELIDCDYDIDIIEQIFFEKYNKNKTLANMVWLEILETSPIYS